MKLQHATLLGIVLGLTCLVAFPSIGLVTTAVPAPAPDSSFEEVSGVEGVTTELIDGALRSLPVVEEPQAADEECEEGWGHWINGPRECQVERYKVHGPKQYCTKITVGGRSYHIEKYDPKRRVFTVRRCFDDPTGPTEPVPNPT